MQFERMRYAKAFRSSDFVSKETKNEDRSSFFNQIFQKDSIVELKKEKGYGKKNEKFYYKIVTLERLLKGICFWQ